MLSGLLQSGAPPETFMYASFEVSEYLLILPSKQTSDQYLASEAVLGREETAFMGVRG